MFLVNFRDILRITELDPLLEKLSVSVSTAKSVEELTRPLLELLKSVTGLESIYLTAIDLERGVQQILFAHNSGQLNIPEGMEVVWADTLCKRALDSGQKFTNDISTCWGDSAAARSLGLVSYMSEPVRFSDGSLYGTLCAAGTFNYTPSEQSTRILSLFASLIAYHVERESLVNKLVQANRALETSALTDPLTNLPNRRALLDSLSRQIANGVRRDTRVLVALIDLDRFKAINDEYGHVVGDKFLVEVSRRISSVLRSEDMAARFGGDEFVVIAPGPATADAVPDALRIFKDRLAGAIAGTYQLGDSVVINYLGASMGVLSVEPGTMDAISAIKQADMQMYEAKRKSRADSSYVRS